MRRKLTPFGSARAEVFDTARKVAVEDGAQSVSDVGERVDVVQGTGCYDGGEARLLRVDPVINGIGKEGRVTQGASPLGGRVRGRDELRPHSGDRSEGSAIKMGHIVPDCLTELGQGLLVAPLGRRPRPARR